MNKTLSDRRDELLDTQDGLQYIAKETGGFAILNNNDLSGGVRKILNDQSYYLIAYRGFRHLRCGKAQIQQA